MQGLVYATLCDGPHPQVGQRVCNTTEDPCIYDDNNKNLVSVHRSEDEVLLTFSTNLNLPQRYSTYYRYLLVCLTLPKSARDTRYPSAVRIQDQPRIYLPRFSWIWDRWGEATAGSLVIFGEESKVDRSRRSAACCLVGFAISAHILATDGQFCVERFCFVLNNARPLASIAIGNGVFWDGEGRKRFLSPHFSNSKLTFYSTHHRDIYQIRWFDDSNLWHRSRWRWQSSKCGGTSGKKVQKTIVRVYLSTACRCLLRRQVQVNLCQSLDHINPMTDLHSETGKHQTRWKFSSRGRHPHWMIPLSRCLFRCSEIILSSVFNMQLIRMLYSHIVHETWQWPFSTWPRRSWMKFELFVLIITNDCVRLKWSMFLCRWRTTSVTRLDMRLPAHLWLRLSIFAPPKDYRTERTEVGYTLREEDKL